MRLQTGEQDRIIVMATDSSGAGVTGATVALSIRRQADGYYFNGTTFQSAFTTVTMTQTDSSNLPGAYHYDFNAPLYDANLTAIATCSSATVVNGPWVEEIKVGNWVDNLDAAMTSRASDTDMNDVLKRIGATIVELDMRRIVGMLDRIMGAVKAVTKR